MIDFIQGNKFKGLTGIHYAPPRGLVPDNRFRDSVNNIPKGDYRYLENTMDVRVLKEGDVIYTHTFYVDQLFELIGGLNVNVTVITHNCDTTFAIAPPPNVIKWFSQNVSILHDRVASLPIGLENDIWLGDKLVKMKKKKRESRQFKKLVYLNHNINNNPEKRQRPYDVLKAKLGYCCEQRAI
jgi:hypothetical protein